VTEQEQFEAGVFGLMPQGWVLLKRRIFPNQDSAGIWMQHSANSRAAKNPSQKIRGSVVQLDSWLTLEGVLDDYETKRKAGDPEFSEAVTRIFKVGNKITASYTARQGQYLAFIHHYMKLRGQPPSEAEMQQRFKVSPPAVHNMILMLEKKGLITHTPGMSRSICVLLPREQLPELE